MELRYVAPGPVASAFMRSNARRRYLQGPFGSGKSSVSMMEIVRRAGEQKHAPDGFRHTRWAVVRNTVPQLRDTTIKTWFSWFPPGSIGYWRSTEKCFYIQEGDMRAEVLFRALDDPDDIKNLLSLELTGAFFNECREIPRDIVDAMDGRIERFPAVKDGGQTWRGMWGDTNPPEEDTYWWAVAEGLSLEQGDEFGKELPPGEDNGWESFIQPSGLSPHAENLANLPDGYYTNLMKGKTKEYIKVYIEGRYGSTRAGLPVHPDFSSTLHLRDDLVANPHLPIILSADFGLTPAITFKQQDVHGRVLTLDEVVTQGMGLERALNEKAIPLINRKYHGARFFVTGDPAGNSASQTDEKTCVTIFKKAGFKKVKFAHTNNPIERIAATDHFLTRLVGGEPAYAVNRSTCPTLIRGLRSGYHYPISQKGIPSEHPLKNLYSHICEANQYGDMLFKRGFNPDEAASRAAQLAASQSVRAGSYTKRS